MQRVVLDVEGVAEFERRIEVSGVPLDELMRRAGLAVANAVLSVGACGRLEVDGREGEDLDLSGMCGVCQISRCVMRRACGNGFPFDLPRVAVLAGTGNNGGDGWTAAEVLVEAGCEVTLLTPCEAEALKAEPARSEALRITSRMAEPEFARLSVVVMPDEAGAWAAVAEADVIVDALLGVGFRGVEMREPLASWARAANEARQRGALVVSADVPSGMNAQTGELAETSVTADVTVTMLAGKPGLLLPSSAERVGKLVYATLGLSADSYRVHVPASKSVDGIDRLDLLEKVKRYVDEALRPRRPRSFSVSFGSSTPSSAAERVADASPLDYSSRDDASIKFAPMSAAMPAPCFEPCFGEGFGRDDLLDVLESLDAPFSVLLLSLIDARGLTDVEVYKRAGMSRQLFSKIRSSADYRPTKKTVLALAIALELSLEETQELLARAGFALSRSSKADVIVEYFIVNEIYDIMAVNEALFAFDQPLL